MKFDPEIGERICQQISTSKDGVFKILKSDEDFPGVTVFYEWLAAEPDFAKRYARAKDLQQDLLFEECIEIADDSSQDVIISGREGEEREVCNSEFVQRSKVRIDTRKWMLAKLNPKKYGDKQQIEQTNIQKYEDLSEDEIKARLEEIRKRRGESGS